jgi:hypothetical protein
MTIEQIKEKSGLSLDIAESLYWKSIWLREAEPTENISWNKMLKDRNYRCMKKDSLNKH